LAYIFVADSMSLSSLKFVQLAPKDASMLQQSVIRNGFWRQNSHSRSFILQSVTGRQGVACRHIQGGPKKLHMAFFAIALPILNYFFIILHY